MLIVWVSQNFCTSLALRDYANVIMELWKCLFLCRLKTVLVETLCYISLCSCAGDVRYSYITRLIKIVFFVGVKTVLKSTVFFFGIYLCYLNCFVRFTKTTKYNNSFVENFHQLVDLDCWTRPPWIEGIAKITTLERRSGWQYRR